MARSRKYRMTPKRRAALKKAQLASARSRRGKILKGIGIAAGVAAIGVGSYYGGKHVRTIRRKQNAIKALNGKKITITIQRVAPRTGRYSGVAGISMVPHGMVVHHSSMTHGIRITNSKDHIDISQARRVVAGTKVKGTTGDPLSHVSNEGKKYRQEISSKTGKASGGSAESRIVPSTRSLWEKQTYYSDLRHRQGR